MKDKKTRIFYLKKKVIFPHSSLSVSVSSTNLTGGLEKGDMIISFPVRTILDLLFHRNRLATLTEIININPAENNLLIQLKGISRVRIKKIIRFQFVEYEIINDPPAGPAEEWFESLRKKTQELIFLINVEESDKLIRLLNYLTGTSQMTDFIANYFVIEFQPRYRLFNELDVSARSEKILAILDDLIEEIKNKRETETRQP